MVAALPLSPDEAIAAVVAAVGPAPDAATYAAHPVDSSCLASVALLDHRERGFPHIFAGGDWLVGPDGKVFAVSSNSAIHDRQVVTRLLDRIYSDELAAYVEPEPFMRRIQRLTQERDALARAVLLEARAGGLRDPRPRLLP